MRTPSPVLPPASSQDTLRTGPTGNVTIHHLDGKLWHLDRDPLKSRPALRPVLDSEIFIQHPANGDD